ncbi:hypothetical protein ACHHYP_05386 [Achlya hypogyna]|uniref:Transmembrane protein n=1 Tax=Achlya hypogyna TaxID=1202772 RepID=A0A1V9YY22_ACHHY|nr:hypothetical protein ACHHYP_05386 [Achlya hypogyna]
MLPYCSSYAPDVWLCLRGLTVGTMSLWTTVACVYLVACMLPVSLSVPHLRANVAMVTLAGLEMFLVLVRSLWLDAPKLMIGAKYCRGMQVSISCWLYGTMACEITNRRLWTYGLLAPVLIGVTVLMTANVVVMLDDPIVDCHHSSWLVMSLASASLAVSFALSGSVVLKEIRAAKTIQRHAPKGLGTTPAELERSYQQLWLLIMVLSMAKTNMISSVLQLLYDLYITYLVTGDQNCTKLFYDDDDGAIEQIIRFLIAVGSFVYPEWVTLYVFYWIPRHQFSTQLDVPELDIVSDDDTYQLYQPLVTSPRPAIAPRAPTSHPA